MLEVHCRTYRENYGDKFVCIVPTNIYGPHDNFDLENGHVLPALIHKCYLAKQKNIDFVVRGSGRPLRQFIYSEDLAIIIMFVLKKFEDGNIILSVSENDEISIGDVARFIAKSFDYQHRMVFDTNYSDGQFKKTVSNAKLLEFLREDFKFTPIEEGIQKTVDWFILSKNQNMK